jgi:hypothetical protein
VSQYFRRELSHEFRQPFKRIDFTMLGKKRIAVNRRRQGAGKRIGKANEIIVL